jgi:hypothetical protein
MREALVHGIDHLMLTTHPEAPSLLKSMIADQELCRFRIIPAVPYLHRLNGIVASQGIPAALAGSISYSMLVRNIMAGTSLTAAGLAAFLEKETQQVRNLGFSIPYVAEHFRRFVDRLGPNRCHQRSRGALLAFWHKASCDHYESTDRRPTSRSKDHPLHALQLSGLYGATRSDLFPTLVDEYGAPDLGNGRFVFRARRRAARFCRSEP